MGGDWGPGGAACRWGPNGLKCPSRPYAPESRHILRSCDDGAVIPNRCDGAAYAPKIRFQIGTSFLFSCPFLRSDQKVVLMQSQAQALYVSRLIVEAILPSSHGGKWCLLKRGGVFSPRCLQSKLDAERVICGNSQRDCRVSGLKGCWPSKGWVIQRFSATGLRPNIWMNIEGPSHTHRL